MSCALDAVELCLDFESTSYIGYKSALASLLFLFTTTSFVLQSTFSYLKLFSLMIKFIKNILTILVIDMDVGSINPTVQAVNILNRYGIERITMCGLEIF